MTLVHSIGPPKPRSLPAGFSTQCTFIECTCVILACSHSITLTFRMQSSRYPTRYNVRTKVQLRKIVERYNSHGDTKSKPVCKYFFQKLKDHLTSVVLHIFSNNLLLSSLKKHWFISAASKVRLRKNGLFWKRYTCNQNWREIKNDAADTFQCFFEHDSNWLLGKVRIHKARAKYLVV